MIQLKQTLWSKRSSWPIKKVASPIPIKNIYFLLCYAWNRLNESELVDVSGVDSTELADLFATVLVNGTNHLLRRGLDQGYLAHEEELSTIRGRIDITATAQRMLIHQGRAYCAYDELSPNTLPNQIIKSTLKLLRGISTLDNTLRARVARLHRDLGHIDDIPLNKFHFRKVQLHSNNRFYKFLLNICEMIQSAYLVDEFSGQYRFRDFIRDDKAMARLFESFIFNFYKMHLSDLSVKKERLNWSASSTTDPTLSLLPTMETDISIRSPKRTLIIDAKYYSKTFQSYYDSESIHSANLYQIMTYLRTLENNHGPDVVAEGMLLYPVVSRVVRESYVIEGHQVSICTLDLSKDWREIHEELLELANF